MRSSLILRWLLILGLFLLNSCITNEKPIQSKDTGAVELKIQLFKIGALRKIVPQGEINLSQLILELTSQGEEPIHDTVAISGNENQSVLMTFNNLASLKVWTISATSYDDSSKVIHSGQESVTIQPGETANVSLNLDAAYSMLKANFINLPDSITKLQLSVNANNVAENSFEKNSKSGDTIKLNFNYLPASHDGELNTIRLDVFGIYWGTEYLLYTGDTTIITYSGLDSSYTVALNWVGPDTPPEGAANITVTLGAVGSTVINGTFEPNNIVGNYVKLEVGVGQYPTINDSGEISYVVMTDTGGPNMVGKIVSTTRGSLTSNEFPYPSNLDMNNSGKIVYNYFIPNTLVYLLGIGPITQPNSENTKPSINDNDEIAFFSSIANPNWDVSIYSSTRGSLVSFTGPLTIGDLDINNFGEINYLHTTQVISTVNGPITFDTDRYENLVTISDSKFVYGAIESNGRSSVVYDSVILFEATWIDNIDMNNRDDIVVGLQEAGIWKIVLLTKNPEFYASYNFPVYTE